MKMGNNANLVSQTDYIKQLILNVFNDYFLKGEKFQINDLLDDNITFIDAKNMMVITGKKSVINIITPPFKNDKTNIINNFSCDVVSIDEKNTLFLSTGIISIKNIKWNKNKDVLVMRFSFTLKKYGANFKFLHCHFSLPTNDINSPNSNSIMFNTLAKQQKQIDVHNIEYESFLNNMHGAAVQCEIDDGFTINFLTKGFYYLTGYKKEDIENIFENKYFNIIYEKDRKRVNKSITEQLVEKNEFEIEYRIKCANEKLIWVIERGNLVEYLNEKKYIYSLITDITGLKRVQEELKLSLERHQIIIDQTNDIVFEWDLQKDSIYFSNNWKKLFGYEPITKDININFFENLRIHKDDLQGFYDMITVVLNGGKYLDHECRLQKQDGQYIWVKIKLTIQQDENKKPIKGVGVIININDSKNESLRLIKEAQIDSLTQVYNKMTAETLIKNYFKEMTNEELCALLILDADYFKKINDENGHYFGDLFIKEAAKAIKSTVKDIDIVGRMGGDEFIILLKNIFINDYSWQKAEEILKAFRKIRVKTSTGQILQQREYSCSIGIAIYNDKSITFEEIYKKADSALYKAKEKGRNCFYICN